MEFDVYVKFVVDETKIHKMRDEWIHWRPGTLTNPTLSFSLNIKKTAKVVNDQDVTSDAFTSPYHSGRPESFNTSLGSISMDRVRVRMTDAAGDSSNRNFTQMNGVFQSTSFNGGWLKINPSCFTQSGGFSTSLSDADNTLPSDGVVVLDNGMMLRLKDGAVVESVVSDKKWDGNDRLTSMQSDGVVTVSGSMSFYDYCDDDRIYPFPVINEASVNISTSSPVSNLTIKTRSDADYVPYGTMHVLRYRDSREWESLLMREPMQIGDFFVHENDPVAYEKVKQQPSHSVNITLRKIPGFVYDLQYPAEQNRDYKLDAQTITPVFHSNTGKVVDKVKTEIVTIKVKQHSTRWKLNEIPIESHHDTQWTDDTGFANIIKSRNNHTNNRDHVHGYPLVNNKADWKTRQITGGTNKDMITDGPGGHEIQVQQSTSDGGNADGGFIINCRNLDNTKSHIVVTHFRKTSDSGTGSFYIGPNNVVEIKSGKVAVNPYYHGTALTAIPKGVWCMCVYFIHGKDETGHSEHGGLWRLDTMAPISRNGDYSVYPWKFRSTSDEFQIRTYQYYTDDSPSHGVRTSAGVSTG